MRSRLPILLLSSLWLLAARAAALTLEVNTSADSLDAIPGDGLCETAPGNGVCSLRAALREANATPGLDTIRLPPGTYALTRPGAGEDLAATGDLDVTDDLLLQGVGAPAPVLDAGQLDRVLDIHAGVQATLSGLRLRNGRVPGGVGGAVRNAGALTLRDCEVQASSAPAGFGGGLHNVSSLALIRTRVTGCSAFAGGGIDSPVGSVSLRDARIDTNAATNGAGISTGGALTLTGTTLDANIALAQAGGIDVLGGTLSATSSTLSGNRAGTLGGGLSVATGLVLLDSVTFGANSADLGANAIASTVAIELRGVLIDSSGGSAAESCLGPIDSLGHNRADDASCGLDHPGDLPPGSGGLGPLAQNGGPTPTHALLPGSAAIDAGDDATCPALDQRGVARRFGSSGISSCDIGAFEVEVVPLAVNSTADAADALPGDGVCQTSTPGECTLRAAVAEANARPGVDVIRLGAGVHGLSDPLGALAVEDSVLIEGTGASATRIEGAWPVDPQPLLLFAAGAGASELAHLALAGGRGASGPGCVSSAAALTLESVELGDCSGVGGGAVGSSADLFVRNSAFIGNAAAQRGGAIHQSGAGSRLEITNSTFADNTAAAAGGAIALAAGSALVLNATFSGNAAPVLQGAALHVAAPFELANSALDLGAVGGPLCSLGAGGALTSLGGNVVEDASCGAIHASDQPLVDPGLEPEPALNGGTTVLFELVAGSPALDAGLNDLCPDADQRGVARPVDGDGDAVARCDSGAAEWSGDSDLDGAEDASDACPTLADDQSDSGGVGESSPPDGIGDACQCGDLDADFFVTDADVGRIRGAAAGAFVLGPAEIDRCAVIGSAADCNLVTAVVLRRALAQLPPPPQQVCGAID